MTPGRVHQVAARWAPIGRRASHLYAPTFRREALAIQQRPGGAATRGCRWLAFGHAAKSQACSPPLRGRAARSAILGFLCGPPTRPTTGAQQREGAGGPLACWAAAHKGQASF